MKRSLLAVVAQRTPLPRAVSATPSAGRRRQSFVVAAADAAPVRLSSLDGSPSPSRPSAASRRSSAHTHPYPCRVCTRCFSSTLPAPSSSSDRRPASETTALPPLDDSRMEENVRRLVDGIMRRGNFTETAAEEGNVDAGDGGGGDPPSSSSSSSSRDADLRRRLSLARAITLAESTSPSGRRAADAMFDRLRRAGVATVEEGDDGDGGCDRCGEAGVRGAEGNERRRRAPQSFRLGIAGPPGVGKSTFVETLGLHVLGLSTSRDESEDDDGPSPSRLPPFAPERLAVLCVDPSSHLTGGSILGDKTRMAGLSCHPRAYIRPSPSSGTLGGVGARTRDAVELCEIAGYGLVIVETVGLGQSEVELDECVDAFVLLLAPGGGDELQGYKKGVIEASDLLVVNKADGPWLDSARKTANEYSAAVSLLRRRCEDDPPPVLLASAMNGDGVPEVWDAVVNLRSRVAESGALGAKRVRQDRYWMRKYLQEFALEAARKNPAARRRAQEVEQMVDNGTMAPRIAAGELWKSIVRDGGGDDDVGGRWGDR